MFIYKFLHSIKIRIASIVNYYKTIIIFKHYNVVYHSITTRGVPLVVCDKTSKIVLGNNIKINNSLYSNQIGYNTPCILRAENGNIVIGDNVGMSQTAIIASGANVKIGNHTLLGGGVKIYTSDFHSINYEYRMSFSIDKQHRKNCPITIGNDCFIGAGSIILKGVTVGDRTVIGAGSVVTKDIPSDCIAGGNPCRVLRSNIN